MTTQPKLLPCPWCGTEPGLEQNITFYVRCPQWKCPTSPRTQSLHKTAKSAIKEWNTRHTQETAK